MAYISSQCIKSISDKLETGILFRYHETDPESSAIVRAEKDLAEMVTKKYGCMVNSCGSALFLALKAMGVGLNTKVLVNAITFDAVPAAIHHCGAQAVLVECCDDLTINLEDLEKNMVISRAKFLLLSHMRGRIADMDKVTALCDKYCVELCEDCAHALACRWKNKPIGSFGKTSCFSFQSHKIINSGEGGFVASSDPDIMAQVILFSGAYELKYKKHFLDIENNIFDKYLKVCPNYSMRMTSIQGEIVYSQINQLEHRVEIYRKNYENFISYFTEKDMSSIFIVIHHNIHSRPVLDSIQFKLIFNSNQQYIFFNNRCLIFGCECFGLKSNARNYKRWDFLNSNCILNDTDTVLNNLYDIRLSVNHDDQSITHLALNLKELINDTIKSIL